MKRWKYTVFIAQKYFVYSPEKCMIFCSIHTFQTLLNIKELLLLHDWVSTWEQYWWGMEGICDMKKHDSILEKQQSGICNYCLWTVFCGWTLKRSVRITLGFQRTKLEEQVSKDKISLVKCNSQTFLVYIFWLCRNWWSWLEPSSNRSLN